MPHFRGCIIPVVNLSCSPVYPTLLTLQILFLYCIEALLSHLCFFLLHSLPFKVFLCCLCFPLWLKISPLSSLSISLSIPTHFFIRVVFWSFFSLLLSPLRYVNMPLFSFSKNTFRTVRLKILQTTTTKTQTKR